MRTVLIAMLMVCLFAVPAFAINGHLAFDYDLKGGAHGVELFAYQDIDNLKIGGKVLGNMEELDFVLPKIEGYELIAELKLDENLSVGFVGGNDVIEDFLKLHFDYAKVNFKYEF